MASVPRGAEHTHLLSCQRNLVDKAFRLVNTALDYDQSKNFTQARSLYNEALMVIEEEGKLYFDSGTLPQATDARMQMSNIRSKCLDRLREMPQEQVSPGSQEPGWFNKLAGLFAGGNVNNKTPPPLAPGVRVHGDNSLPKKGLQGEGKGDVKGAVKKDVKIGEIEVKKFKVDPTVALSKQGPLKGIDPKIQMTILNDCLDESAGIHWDDIAGLETAKKALQEAVILPSLRPDIFVGLRSPPKGLLLFGPPGTGKTMLARALSTEAKATFFNITAASLVSKWVGEGEKLVKALFALAKVLQPSIIFIDELDSLLGTRVEGEHDAMRRLKNEFLSQFDGLASNKEDRIFVLGTTNRPSFIDEAAMRRLSLHIYIPLPEEKARLALTKHLLRHHPHNLSVADFRTIVKWTEGYSGSDLAHLCTDAAFGPVRELGAEVVKVTPIDQIRPISLKDFQAGLKRVRPTVTDVTEFETWNKKMGITG